MCIVSGESQKRSVPGKGVKIHGKEIHSEFTVDVMQLIFVFAIVFFPVFGIYFGKIVKIVRAL
jgi:hypothetical protein